MPETSLGKICNSCRLRNLTIMPGHNWKGGQIILHGYMWIWSPHHPRAINGYVKRATLAAEDKIGRILLLDEETHHINGIKLDDNPDNLQVLTASEHTNITNRQFHKAKRMMLFRWSYAR